MMLFGPQGCVLQPETASQSECSPTLQFMHNIITATFRIGTSPSTMLYHETSRLRSCHVPLPRLILKPYKTEAHEDSNLSIHRITELLPQKHCALEYMVPPLEQTRYFSDSAHDASLTVSSYPSGFAGCRAKQRAPTDNSTCTEAGWRSAQY